MNGDDQNDEPVLAQKHDPEPMIIHEQPAEKMDMDFEDGVVN